MGTGIGCDRHPSWAGMCRLHPPRLPSSPSVGSRQQRPFLSHLRLLLPPLAPSIPPPAPGRARLRVLKHFEESESPESRQSSETLSRCQARSQSVPDNEGQAFAHQIFKQSCRYRTWQWGVRRSPASALPPLLLSVFF